MNHLLAFCCAATCILPFSHVHGQEPLQVGATVLEENPGEAIASWSSAPWAQAVPEGPDGGICLRIQIPTAKATAKDGSVQKDVWGRNIKLTSGNYSIQRPLDLSRLRGWRVNLVARVRTADVTPPTLPWEGVRIGLNYQTPLIGYDANLTGQPENSDWHEAVLANARIPEDAVATSLNLGLIASTGTLWVDSIRLVLVEPPLSALAAQNPPLVQKAQRRGSGIARATVEIESLIKAWDMNVVKYWIALPSPDLPEAEYLAALEAELAKADSVVAQTTAAASKVILQLSSWSPEKPEGGIPPKGNTHRVFLEPEAMNRFIATWKIIARRYVGHKGIEGYDLMNEPVLRVPVADGCLDWEGLAEALAQAINEIDPKVQIFCQPEEWWGVQAFTKMRPIDAKNITYSVHMYSPFEVTHQGITERKSMGFAYPSTINGKLWDKEALRRALQPARDFQLAYGVPMQVGEFSCIRWAPEGSSARWLADVIELFEEYGWDWTYHALRDWDGWYPALGEDPANVTPPAEPSAAKKVMMAAFAKNPPRTPDPIEIGDIVYHKDFRRGLDGWVSANQCAKTDSVNGLAIAAIGAGESGAIGDRDVLGVVDTSKSSTFIATTGLPLMHCKGYELELVLSVKAEGVPVPPVPWEGVRIAINYLASTGVYSHSYNGLDGTFDWREVRHRFRIPVDAKDLSIDLGLISPTGKAWFDQVTMTVVDIPLAMKTPPPGPAYRGHDLPRVRGFGGSGIKDPRTKEHEVFFREITDDWNANVVKLWFDPAKDLTQVDAALDAWLAGIDRGIELARETRTYLILHVGEFSWLEGHQSLLYLDPAYADKLTTIWETIAKRYKGEKTIWAFELLNETTLRKPPSPGCTDYEAVMERVAKAVNAIDPDRAMIVQCEMWWGTRAFERLRPIQADNIIYAAHIYSPFPVSHQGVGEFLGGATSWKAHAYPGTTEDGVLWNKDTLRRDLQPVLDFQKAYNVHMVVSEFSCIRWALGESRTKLLTDMIDLYEEYGWDWTYHGYPDWHGWNPALGQDPWVETRPAVPSETEVLMKTWFKQNQRPEWDK